MAQGAWWKGTRGEWYVVAQIALIAVLLLGPKNPPGWQPLLILSPVVMSIAGFLLFVSGAAFLLAGIFRLGTNLTPVPYPKDRATLVQSGPYRFVRHPIYCGGIVMSFGWALIVQGWLTLLYAIIIFVFLDIKSRREEKWLMDKFPGYSAYRKRVRRLLPFLY
jgi:protein-S-isoprenylcysteine O-methyltransferase Ste14